MTGREVLESPAAVFNGLDRIWVWNVDAGGMDLVGIEYQPQEWLHLAVTHDGSLLSVCVNGVLRLATPRGLDHYSRPECGWIALPGGLPVWSAGAAALSRQKEYLSTCVD